MSIASVLLARLLIGSALVIGTAAAASAQTSLSQSGLVGTPEGITIVTDPAQWPKTLQRSAAARRAGQGGQAAAGRGAPAGGADGDQAGAARSASTAAPGGAASPAPATTRTATASTRPTSCCSGTTPAPRSMPVARQGRGSMSEDGKTFTLTLRKGMKWSDGAPFTADDFVFWFEDIYSNKDIVPTPIADMQPQGKPGRIVKVDDTTVRLRVRRAVLPVRGHAGRRHADRRRPVGAAVAEAQPSAPTRRRTT